MNKAVAKQTGGKVVLRGMTPEGSFNVVHMHALEQMVSPDGVDLLATSKLAATAEALLLAPSYSAFLGLGVMAYLNITLNELSPRYELAALDSFGCRKYSLHPLAPNSWTTLPVQSFADSAFRHTGEHLRDRPHIEEIEPGYALGDTPSCLMEDVGLTYEGQHLTAVLWNCLRGMEVTK